MRQITKFEATIIQLVNKAASGHMATIKMMLPLLERVAQVSDASVRQGDVGVGIDDAKARLTAIIEQIAARNKSGGLGESVESGS